MCVFQEMTYTATRRAEELLLTDYEARTTGSFVEKKLASVTFHYRNADPEYGEFQGIVSLFLNVRVHLLMTNCVAQPKNVKLY